MKELVIIYFCHAPTDKFFRWGRLFWKRTQQNHAVCMEKNYGITKYFDTIAKVAVYKHDLPPNIEALNLKQILN